MIARRVALDHGGPALGARDPELAARPQPGRARGGPRARASDGGAGAIRQRGGPRSSAGSRRRSAPRCRRTIALVRAWIAGNDPAVYPQIYRVLAEGDAELVQGMERIACPTLVMTGEDDPGNTPAMARAMAGSIPGARPRDPARSQAHGACRSAAGGQHAALCLPARRARADLSELAAENLYPDRGRAAPCSRVVDLRAGWRRSRGHRARPANRRDRRAWTGRRRRSALPDGPLRRSARRRRSSRWARCPSIPGRVPPGRSGSSRGNPARLPRRRAWCCWGRCSSRRWYRDSRRCRPRS